MYNLICKWFVWLNIFLFSKIWCLHTYIAETSGGWDFNAPWLHARACFGTLSWDQASQVDWWWVVIQSDIYIAKIFFFLHICFNFRSNGFIHAFTSDDEIEASYCLLSRSINYYSMELHLGFDAAWNKYLDFNFDFFKSITSSQSVIRKKKGFTICVCIYRVAGKISCSRWFSGIWINLWDCFVIMSFW